MGSAMRRSTGHVRAMARWRSTTRAAQTREQRWSSGLEPRRLLNCQDFKVVRVAGVEPALLAEPDFESGASTNSTTPAQHHGSTRPKARPRLPCDTSGSDDMSAGVLSRLSRPGSAPSLVGGGRPRGVGPRGVRGWTSPSFPPTLPRQRRAPQHRKGHRRGEPPCRITSSRDSWPAAQGRSAASSRRPGAGSSLTVG